MVKYCLLSSPTKYTRSIGGSSDCVNLFYWHQCPIFIIKAKSKKNKSNVRMITRLLNKIVVPSQSHRNISHCCVVYYISSMVGSVLTLS